MAVGRAGELRSWGTFAPFSEWCRGGTQHHHSRSHAQNIPVALSCTLSILENVFLQESDPHIITQFQNDSEDWWFICVCSHYLLISISLQSALYYLRTDHWVCGFSGSFDLPLSYSVTSIFPFQLWGLCQHAREQRNTEKRAQFATCSKSSCKFPLFHSLFIFFSLNFIGWRRQNLKIRIKIVLLDSDILNYLCLV